MNKYTIYTLAHPITGEVKYIGKTTQSLSNRKSLHVEDAKKGIKLSPHIQWMMSLLKEGLRPKIQALETVFCDEKKSFEIEDWWIQQFFAWGFSLNNCTSYPGPGYIPYRLERCLEAWRKPVYQYKYGGEFVAEYPTGRDAEKATGIGFKDISGNCTGVRKSAGGFVWSFTKLENYKGYKPLYSRSRTVYQYSLDGKFIRAYRSAQEAADTVGTSNGTIAGVARGVKHKNTALGFKWSYELKTQEP